MRRGLSLVLALLAAASGEPPAAGGATVGCRGGCTRAQCLALFASRVVPSCAAPPTQRRETREAFCAAQCSARSVEWSAADRCKNYTQAVLRRYQLAGDRQRGGEGTPESKQCTPAAAAVPCDRCAPAVLCPPAYRAAAAERQAAAGSAEQQQQEGLSALFNMADRARLCAAVPVPVPVLPPPPLPPPPPPPPPKKLVTAGPGAHGGGSGSSSGFGGSGLWKKLHKWLSGLPAALLAVLCLGLVLFGGVLGTMHGGFKRSSEEDSQGAGGAGAGLMMRTVRALPPALLPSGLLRSSLRSLFRSFVRRPRHDARTSTTLTLLPLPLRLLLVLSDCQWPQHQQRQQQRQRAAAAG